jgi:hypothetical protein
MISDSTQQLAFKYRVSPHLDVLLQLCMSLTMNGRDAIKLLRESIAEIAPSWEEWMPNMSVEIRLYEVVTRRYFVGFPEFGRPIASMREEFGRAISKKNDRTYTPTSFSTSVGLPDPEESDGLVRFFKSIVALPTSLRTPMMLSYIEGFSNAEIAKLVGVEPQEISRLIYSGCGLLREEIYHLLVGHNDITIAVRQGAESA